MNKHTPAPWYSKRNYILWNHPDGTTYCVADVNNATYFDENNAKRICLCVNACTGIPTEALESGVVMEMISTLDNVISCLGSEFQLPDDIKDDVKRILAKLEG